MDWVHLIPGLYCILKLPCLVDDGVCNVGVLDMGVWVSFKFYVFLEVFDLVKNSVNRGLGIGVNHFHLLFKVDQLVGGDFTICYDEVLDKHKQGSRRLASRPVSHGSDAFGFG